MLFLELTLIAILFGLENEFTCLFDLCVIFCSIICWKFFHLDISSEDLQGSRKIMRFAQDYIHTFYTTRLIVLFSENPWLIDYADLFFLSCLGNCSDAYYLDKCVFIRLVLLKMNKLFTRKLLRINIRRNLIFTVCCFRWKNNRAIIPIILLNLFI